MSELRREQTRRLIALLRAIYPANSFYRRKLDAAGFDPASLDAGAEIGDPYAILSRLPLTVKRELQDDQLASPPYGTNLTFPIERYVRHHQTSGTTGTPLRWLDTAQSWQWFVDCWKNVFRGARATPSDRVFSPFSFGPFIGFWGCFEAAQQLGCFTISGGGLSTVARIDAIRLHEITLVGLTPTYALHIAEVAAAKGIDLAATKVRGLLVAGEPGGSEPVIRTRIADLWGARVYDHCGMTESGAYGVEIDDDPGSLRVIETEFIVEVLDPASGDSVVADGAIGELVLTNLGRLGSPIIRYRTGDSVRWRAQPNAGPIDDPHSWGRLEGGILGRVDDLVFIRGNNVYPLAVESVLRRFGEVAEYRVVVLESGGLADLRIEIEADPACSDRAMLARRVEEAVRDSLHFRAGVELVPPGTLPRFEHKARRWVRERR